METIFHFCIMDLKDRNFEPEFKFKTSRSSGAGGQHVNTTESAVRAVHLSTGLSAIARDERSQSANRKRALERLAILIARQGQREAVKAQKLRWDAHNDLVRGNPMRVYEGKEFRLN